MSIMTGGFLKAKKTLVTAVIGIVSFVGAYLVGDVSLVDLLQVIFPLLGVVFLGREITASVQEKIDELRSKKK